VGRFILEVKAIRGIVRRGNFSGERFKGRFATGQAQVTPKESYGGPRYVQGCAGALTDIPDTFRNLKTLEWLVPTDLKRWRETNRLAIRTTLMRWFGEMPPSPSPEKVMLLSVEVRGVLYKNTRCEYLPEMEEGLRTRFKRALPVER
jgi:hypothetical protein